MKHHCHHRIRYCIALKSDNPPNSFSKKIFFTFAPGIYIYQIVVLKFGKRDPDTRRDHTITYYYNTAAILQHIMI